MDTTHPPSDVGYVSSDDHETMSSSTESEDSIMTDEKPLNELLCNILQSFCSAIKAENGWAWADVDLANTLFNIYTRLLNWRMSIEWLTTNMLSSEENRDLDETIKRFLDTLSTERLSLSATLASYMEDISGYLKEIHNSCQDKECSE
jgi:hypothetical protein